MRILLATMVALVTLAIGALLVSVVQDEQAEAAVAYCGHAYKTYVKPLPSGATVFRISYAWGSTSSQHVHHYRIFRLKKGIYKDRWVYVDSIDRVCLNTHPV